MVRIAAVALFVMVALTACGTGPAPEDTTPQGGAPTPPVQMEQPDQRAPVGPTPGSRAPAIVGVDVTTLEHMGLGELRGKVVLLNFFAAWCIPCQTEMPIMQEMADELSDQLAVVAVGADIAEVPVLLKQFVGDLEIRFPVLYDEGEAARRYRVLGLPASFFIDPEGYVRARVEGPLTEAMIREHLARISGG